MFSDTLFEKNYTLFSAAKPDIKKVNIEEAKNIRDADYKRLKKGDRWKPEKSIIKSAVTLPRNKKVIKTYEKECLKFKLGSAISQYDDIPGGDPHTLQLLLSLAKQSERLGLNSEETTTSFEYAQPYCFYALATGSGIELNEYVKRFDPIKLIISVNDWKDLVSSFWHIDWKKLIEIYPTKEIRENNRAILFTREDDEDSHIPLLNSIGISLLDHSLIYYPTCEEERLANTIENLIGPNLRSTIHYLGFILDEYNMIVNTAGSLPQAKKFYSKKVKVGNELNAVVCGSGPSLDDCLEGIKELSRDHAIIACASNFASLLKAGIRVDILVLLERGLNNYENYSNILAEIDSPNTILICSSTCAPQLHSLFSKSVIYYRPALMPTTLFSPSIEHVLHYEGPQTTNAGLSLAISLNFKNIVLAGVDLGTASQAKVRSKGALGISPRVFDIETQGNKQDIVYTNTGLNDSKRVKEMCIKGAKDQNFFNFSSGVLIKGAKASSHEEYRKTIRPININPSEIIDDLYDLFPNTSIASASRDWESSRFRVESYALLKKIISIVKDDSCSLYPDTIFKLEKLFRLNVPLRQQTPKKLYRSSFIKLIMAIRNQSIVISSHCGVEKAKQFEAYGRALLLELADALVKELFDLSDRIDTLLNNERNTL